MSGRGGWYRGVEMKVLGETWSVKRCGVTRGKQVTRDHRQLHFMSHHLLSLRALRCDLFSRCPPCTMPLPWVMTAGCVWAMQRDYLCCVPLALACVSTWCNHRLLLVLSIVCSQPLPYLVPQNWSYAAGVGTTGTFTAPA